MISTNTTTFIISLGALIFAVGGSVVAFGGLACLFMELVWPEGERRSVGGVAMSVLVLLGGLGIMAEALLIHAAAMSR